MVDEDVRIVDEIIFIVEGAPEGGFTARAAGESIWNEADTRDDLHARVPARVSLRGE
jgi:hypothetical protein